MDIKEDLLLWFTNFVYKNSKVSGAKIPLDFNEQLAEELHKPSIRNLKKRTVYSGFKDDIWVLA